MENNPVKKRRADSFFGLHFDFHAKPGPEGEIVEVGTDTTKEMISKIIDTVEPDFIQIDCKGHPGWSSYPTKKGNPYPVIHKDPLKIWREVTEKRGVALYMHYSGVIDDYQCEKHPEWARKAFGKDPIPDWMPKGVTSTFRPYVDEIMIPQLLELAGEYKVDGVWVDGECWGTQIDYCEKAIKGFKKKTDIDIEKNLPKSPNDKYWYEFAQYCREQFRKYLNHYVDAVHEKYPEFQIASNWAYSSKMPEPVLSNVDFLSGDYLWDNSLNSARYEGRCLAGQKKPWDLMAWGFRWMHNEKFERCPKHPLQLKQEAAVVIALGGGFQSYYPQKKDGRVHMWQVGLMKQVARFCREREEFCHKARFIPQVAVINSTHYRYKSSKFVFQSEGEDGALRGIVESMCEAGISFEVLSEHGISDRMSEYPLIVLPETGALEENFKNSLIRYVRQGGSLLLIGPGPITIFRDLFDQTPEWREDDFLVSVDDVTWAYSTGRIYAVDKSENTTGSLATAKDIDDEKAFAAADIKQFGEGKIARIFSNIGDIYHTRKNHVQRELVKKVCNELYEPMVKLTGSMYLDVTVMKKNGNLCINLVNTAGPHGNKDVFTIDEIPPVGPVELKIRLDKKPGRVSIEPGGRIPETNWRPQAGELDIKIPSVEMHDIVVIREKAD